MVDTAPKKQFLYLKLISSYNPTVKRSKNSGMKHGLYMTDNKLKFVKENTGKIVYHRKSKRTKVTLTLLQMAHAHMCLHKNDLLDALYILTN